MNIIQIAQRLKCKSRIHPPTCIQNKESYPDLDGRGIYAWYFKSLPRTDVPVEECFTTKDGYTLLYVGIAPSLVRGQPSKQTLRKRLRRHYTGNIQGSTLRKSLACLLWDNDELNLEFRKGENPRRPKLTRNGHEALTDWLCKTALISWVSVKEPWIHEVRLIHKFNTPLNIECNQHHPFYRELSRTRAEVLGKGRDLNLSYKFNGKYRSNHV